MYRVGFGDCFLLSYTPTRGEKAHVLIDCGVFPTGDLRTLGRAVDDIHQETGGKLALVIASHQHADHISGFGRFANRFQKEFAVEAVWLPWLENRRDPEVARMQERGEALTLLAQTRLAAAGEVYPEILATLQNLTGLETADFAAHAQRAGRPDELKGNSLAMDVLLNRLKRADGRKTGVEYLGAGDPVQLPDSLHGLTARILAPSRSTEFLRQMDPPEWQHYVEERSAEKPWPSWRIRVSPPFSAEWVMEAANYRRSLERETASTAARNTPGVELDLEQIAAWAREAATNGLAAAVRLRDAHVNNQSLVVLFQMGDRTLLFPGDAQWGNWRSWLFPPDKAPADGDALAPTSVEIMTALDFYKVAHHGSENATPTSAVRALKGGRVAVMCSTQVGPYDGVPKKHLLDALRDQAEGRLVRSDQVAVEGAPPTLEPGPRLPELPRGFTHGKFWFDYILRARS